MFIRSWPVALHPFVADFMVRLCDVFVPDLLNFEDSQLCTVSDGPADSDLPGVHLEEPPSEAGCASGLADAAGSADVGTAAAGKAEASDTGALAEAAVADASAAGMGLQAGGEAAAGRQLLTTVASARSCAAQSLWVTERAAETQVTSYEAMVERILRIRPWRQPRPPTTFLGQSKRRCWAMRYQNLDLRPDAGSCTIAAVIRRVPHYLVHLTFARLRCIMMLQVQV